MHLQFETEIPGNYLDIIEKFDKDLFEALKPIGVKMEIVEFTGSKTGDKVHIRFVSPIKAEWVSHITDHGHDDHRAYFVDEGVILPFGIKTWKHRHIVVRKDDNRSIIVDDINYTGMNILWSWLLYPGLFLGFYPRKKIYKKYFTKT